MRVAIAADHAGFDMKEQLRREVELSGHQVNDLGAHQLDMGDDYPDFAEAMGRAIQNKAADRGILICGSGVGASVAVNKLRGVRAGLCHDSYSAHQGVEHDDMNVLVLGSRVIGIETAKELVGAFLRAEFSGEDRHRRRLKKVRQLEESAG